MALSVNTSASTEIIVREKYAEFVKKRIGKDFYRFPVAWNSLLPRVISNAKACEAEIADFVEAQFLLTRTFCLSAFQMTYPPLPCFTTEKARMRYRKFKMDKDSKEVGRIESDVGMMVTKQLPLASYHVIRRDMDNLLLMVSSGTLSVHTVFEIWKKVEDKAFVEDFVDYTEYFGTGGIKVKFEKIKESWNNGTQAC